jgi:serine/threonine protein kinase
MFTKKNIRETYKIQETIGSGQTSIVKKCKNRKTKEKFAVKVIPKNSLTDDQIL